MNILDLLIIIFCIGALFRGMETGFVREFLSTAGFVGGLLIGILLQPHFLGLVSGDTGKTVVTLLVVLLPALLLMGAGEYLGVLIKRKIIRSHSANPIDYIVGGVVGILSMLLTVWLFANLLVAFPYPGLRQLINGSSIVRQLDSHLPSAPRLMDGLGHLIDPNGFPDVFAGLEPPPSQTVNQPGLEGFQTALAATRASVVKIEGPGCGGIVEGSGFVVGKDLVATNAHVIAGTGRIIVQDTNGSHTAVPIWFDDKLDFAVLRVSGLSGKPLSMVSIDPEHGTPAAILGYPGGGTYAVKSAAILNKFTAIGHDIYGEGTTKRLVYELQADIIPGNSGGPVINQRGQVIAVVFAESATYEHIGYALDTRQVQHDLDEAIAQNRTRSTGSCAE